MSLITGTENDVSDPETTETSVSSTANAQAAALALTLWRPFAPGFEGSSISRPVIESSTFGQSVFDAEGNLAAFTCFGKLPKEVRLMIWEWISRRPRVVRLFNKTTKTGRNSPIVFSPTPPPILLSISSEARAFGLLKYKLSFAREQLVASPRRFLPRVYFNFEYDILALDQSIQAPLSRRFYMLMVISAVDLSQVQSVLINDYQLQTISGQLSVFSNLNQLYVSLMTSLHEPNDSQSIPTLQLTELSRFPRSQICMANVFEAKVRKLLRRLSIWPKKSDQDDIEFNLEAVIVSHLNERVPYSSIP